MRITTLLLFASVLLATPVVAQQNWDAVEIEAIQVADGVFMLVGSGGNIGLSVGDDGAFLIDDQFAPLTDKIRAAVAAQTDHEVRFVINTHWHGDHTGGNESWGESGALLVAHENVRERMSTDQFLAAMDRSVPASPDGALPVVTFTDAVTFHWNGDDIRASHVVAAHTDGDAIVHFAGANVVHAGDTFFNGSYPFIDVSTGGTLDGMIAAADAVLGLANDDTKIIPGHGPLAKRADLEAYRDMLVVTRDRVGALIADGMSRDDVIAARPMRDYDEAWSRGSEDSVFWLGIAYDAVIAGR